MAAKKGLGDVQITRPTRSRNSLTVVGKVNGGGGPQDFDLATLSTNPLNPQWRQQTSGEDFERLVASIAAVGVLQPLLVTSAESWRTEHRADADRLDDGAEWVVLDGNRRLVAARVAEREALPAIVRDDLAADDASVMIHANGARAALTPIDEALAYQRLIAAGLTQSKIAHETGVSQPVIAKRLKLLSLPESFQDGVASGLIPINDALDLIKNHEPDDLVAAGERYAEVLRKGEAHDWSNRPATLVRAASEERRAREATQQAKAVAESQPEKFTFIASADKIQDRYGRRLTKEQVAKAEEPVLVAGNPWSGEVEYFSSAPGKATKVDEREMAKKREDASRREAAKKRAEYAAHLAKTTPAAGDLRAALAQMMVKGQHPDSEVRRAAWKIAIAAELAPGIEGLAADEKDKARYAFETAVQASAGTPSQDAMAWLMVVAYHERSLANTYSNPWATKTAQWYYGQLERVGYTPTEWEAAQLDHQEEDQ